MSPPWLTLVVLCAATAAGQPQRTFDTAQSAADALIAAAQKGDVRLDRHLWTRRQRPGAVRGRSAGSQCSYRLRR